AGSPPFGTFLSEWLLLNAALSAGHVGAAIVVLVGLTVTFVAVAHHVGRVLFGGHPPLAAKLPSAGWSVAPALLMALSLLGGLPAGVTEFASLTARVPAAHWAERAIGDFFGLRAEGHPRWKGLLLHEAWPDLFAPLRNGSVSPVDPAADRKQYAFLQVEGEGV